MKIYVKNKGALLVKKGNDLVPLDSFHAAAQLEGSNLNCDCGIVCCGDKKVIQFLGSDNQVKEIGLQMLYDFFVANGQIDSVAPTAPVLNAAGSIAQTTLTLTWTAGTDANLSVHEVFQDGVLIETVTAGTNTLAVTGLTAATSYDFTVIAVDIAGNRSPVSNTVTAVTTA